MPLGENGLEGGLRPHDRRSPPDQKLATTDQQSGRRSAVTALEAACDAGPDERAEAILAAVGQIRSSIIVSWLS
jgi:hypothetical protein